MSLVEGGLAFDAFVVSPTQALLPWPQLSQEYLKETQTPSH